MSTSCTDPAACDMQPTVSNFRLRCGAMSANLYLKLIKALSPMTTYRAVKFAGDLDIVRQERAPPPTAYISFERPDDVPLRFLFC
eukprot:3733727-Pyramimonas_sp.AAC.1